MTDQIKLTVPNARPYHGVVRLVMGGLAARLELPYEYLEDLQLAVEGLLASEDSAAGDEVTMEVRLLPGSLEVVVGPLAGERLDASLEAASDESEGVGLHRLLTTVTGGFEVERRDGGEWIRFRKDIPTPGAVGGR